MNQPENTAASKSRTYRRIKHGLWLIIFLSVGWMLAGEFQIVGFSTKSPADAVFIFAWASSIIVQYFSGEEIATGAYLKIPAGPWNDGLRLFTLLFGGFMLYIAGLTAYFYFSS